MADGKCSRLEMPADGVDEIDKMRDARWKRADEMESADWMEIWGVRWRPQDERVVPALNCLGAMPLKPGLLLELRNFVQFYE